MRFYLIWWSKWYLRATTYRDEIRPKERLFVLSERYQRPAKYVPRETLRSHWSTSGLPWSNFGEYAPGRTFLRKAGFHWVFNGSSRIMESENLEIICAVSGEKPSLVGLLSYVKFHTAFMTLMYANGGWMDFLLLFCRHEDPLNVCLSATCSIIWDMRDFYL